MTNNTRGTRTRAKAGAPRKSNRTKPTSHTRSPATKKRKNTAETEEEMGDLSGSTEVEDGVEHTPPPKKPRKTTKPAGTKTPKHKCRTSGSTTESSNDAGSESSRTSPTSPITLTPAPAHTPTTHPETLSPGTHAALTAALHAALLPCLDLVDPLLEFTRACATIKDGSARQRYVDEQEGRVRGVVEGLRGRFGGG